MKRLSKKISILLITIILIIITSNFTFTTYAYDNAMVGNRCYITSFFIDDTTYQTSKKEKIILTNESVSNWFDQQFNSCFQFKWILDPKSPITFGEFLKLIFHLQTSAFPDRTYPRKEVNYEDLNDFFYCINMIEILSSTGSWNNPSILSGTPTDTGLKLNFDEYITRAQVAKIIDSASTDWYKLPKIRNYSYFSDISASWAKESIKNAYEYGFLNGKSNNEFDPTGLLSIEEAITILYNIVNVNNSYSFDNFVTSINCSDVVKITEVYLSNFNTTLGTKPLLTEFYYNGDLKDTWPPCEMPKKDTILYGNNTIHYFYDSQYSLRFQFNIYTYLTSRIGPIKIIPPDKEGIIFENDGTLYGMSYTTPGTYTFKIINEYGDEYDLNLEFYSSASDLKLTKETPKESLRIPINTFRLNLGEGLNLLECIENVHGNVQVICQDAKYTSFDGISTITLVKKPPAVDEFNTDYDIIETVNNSEFIISNNTDYDTIYIYDDYSSVPLYIKSYVN